MIPTEKTVPVRDKPIDRAEALPWLKKRPKELRAEECQIVNAISSRSRSPKKQIREFVRSFMSK